MLYVISRDGLEYKEFSEEYRNQILESDFLYFETKDEAEQHITINQNSDDVLMQELLAWRSTDYEKNININSSETQIEKVKGQAGGFRVGSGRKKGFKMSEEQKNKIANSMKGNNNAKKI